MDFHALAVTTLDGKRKTLAEYQGSAVLVVNTASACGYTPQYAGLEQLHEELGAQGLVVLGVPSNDFGAQEPGTAQQIGTFCSMRFNVKFPMLEKQTVVGEKKSPLYSFLTRYHGEPQWNFHKYLVNRAGVVQASFASDVAPESPELRAALETALKRG